MDSDKNVGYEEAEEGKDNELPSEGAPRARNRTVLLTPEITNQVRARLAQQNEPYALGGQGEGDAAHGVDDGGDYGGGFMPVGRRRMSDDAEHEGRRRLSTGPSGGLPLSEPGEAAAAPGPYRSAPARVAALGKDAVVWSKMTPMVGCLISFDQDPNGDVFILRSGRLIVTSQEPPGGSYLFLTDETVSVMHAILRVSEVGEIQVLDQLSEFGSAVKRFGSEEETVLSGEKCSLEHGDVIRFGNRSFHVCIIAKEK